MKHRLDLPRTDCGNPRSKSYLANSMKYYKTRFLKYDHLYFHLVVEGQAMIFPDGYFGICSKLQWKTTKIQLFPTIRTENWRKRTQVHSWHPSPWDPTPQNQHKQILNDKALGTKLLGFIRKLSFIDAMMSFILAISPANVCLISQAQQHHQELGQVHLPAERSLLSE